MQANVETPDGSVEFDQTTLDGESGWYLLAGAAAECSVHPSGGAFTSFDPVIPPWGARSWFIFEESGPADSCDILLARQQALLCTADKLMQVAEAVTPLHWQKTSNLTIPEIKGPWLIPVQNSQDRFIARELSIHVLAHLAWLDVVRVSTPVSFSTCTQGYADAIAVPSNWASYAWTALFKPYETTPTHYKYAFHPTEKATDIINPLWQDELRSTAETRLRFKVQILRHASRLLERLVTASIQEDVGAAARIRAKAGDHERGLAAMWGTGEGPKWNSISHALRVAFGRWEMGSVDGHKDPHCEGLYTNKSPWLFGEGAFGPDLPARTEDLPVTTSGQKKAIEWVQSSGLILTKNDIDNPANLARGYLTEQVIFREAVRHGLASDLNQFKATGQGAALKASLDAIPDADLRFALHHIRRQYMSLAGISENATSMYAEPIKMLVAPGAIQSDSVPSSAVLLEQGIPRQALAADVFSRAGGFLTASQCGESWEALSADYGAEFMFQDSFALGQKLGKRLTALREYAASAGLADSDIWRTAAAGAAETREWAGGGTMTAYSEDGDSEVGYITIEVTGFRPEDWGLKTYEEMGRRLVLVYGEPWVADCAARLRNDVCPSDFEDAYVMHPGYGFVEELLGADRKSYGSESHGVFWYSQPLKGSPQLTGLAPLSQPPTSRLYAVIQQSAGNPSKGSVLGAFSLRQSYSSTAVAVSERRRKLTNELVGVNQDWAIKGDDIGRPGLGFPGSYCVPGAQWNQFVPLENEITSDSDQYESSWRHYLTLAKLAAAKADELGQKLINTGLSRDERREAAQEAVAEVCGNYSALDDVDLSTGEVKAKENGADQSTADCLGLKKHDIVFLTNDIARATPTQKDPDQSKLKEVIGCPGYGGAGGTGGTGGSGGTGGASGTGGAAGDPRCERELSSAGLGLVEALSDDGTKTDAGGCATTMAVVESLYAGGFESEKLASLAAESWLQKAHLAGLSKLSFFRVYRDSPNVSWEWRVASNGSTVMDSGKNSGIWPGCRRYNATQCGPEPDPEVFDKIFRGGDKTATLDDAGLATLRWRVEGAFWTIAALSGDPVPEGMFEKHVPVLDLTNTSALQPLPAPAVYGMGKLQQTGWAYSNAEYDTWALTPGSGDSGDKEEDCTALGEVVAPPLASMVWDSAEFPMWLRTLYKGPPSPLFHTLARNDSYAIYRAGPSEPGAFIKQTAPHFRGLVCSSSDLSEEVSPAANASAGNAAMSSLKMGPQNMTRLCSHPSVDAGLLWAGALADGDLQLDDAVAFVPKGYPFDIKSWCHGYYSENASELVPLFPESEAEKDVFSLASGCFGTRSRLGMGDYQAGGLAYGDLVGTPLYSPKDTPAVGRRFPRRVLLPHVCTKQQRIVGAVNSYAPTGTCGAARELAAAVALTCQLSHSDIFPVGVNPPEVNSIEAMAGFKRWLEGQSRLASSALQRLYLVDIPEQVVSDVLHGKVTPDGANGEHGRILLQMGTAVRNLVANWRKLESDIRQLSLVFDAAQNELMAAKIHEKQALKGIAMQRISVHIQMASAFAQGMSVFSVKAFIEPSTAATAIASEVTLELCKDQLSALSDLQALAEEENSNQMASALIRMQQGAQPLYADAEASIIAIQSSVAEITSLGSQLRQSESKAKYEIAKGMGEDFVKINGEVVEFPVNTVLRREYQVTRLRYERALRDARYLAYMARLAIEQRIGARLNSIDTPVGALDPPSQWADDVCTLQGINYEQYSKAYDADAGTGPTDDEEKAAIQEFADQYIGDYVAKLENFVEYYNIQYPSHDGDDTAVLSLREDLLGSDGSCIQVSPNLLFFSHELEKSAFVSNGTESARQGWETEPCQSGVDRCLAVKSGSALPSHGLPPADQVGGGVSWLRETVPPLGTGGSGGAGGAGDSGAGGLGGSGSSSTDAPGRSVHQAVSLDAGEYVLSWWDQARTAGGDRFSLLADPDMEAAGAENWSAVRATVFKETANPYSGKLSLSINPTGLSAYAGQDVLVNGKVYRVRGRARSNGTNLPTVSLNNVLVWTGTSSQDWQYFDVTGTADGATLKLGTNTTAYGYVHFDELLLDRTNEPLTPPDLAVAVYDSSWTLVKSSIEPPHWSADWDFGSVDWGVRKELPFKVDSKGTFHVAFSASLAAQSSGSVAIANVQLEKVSAPGAKAGPYIGTSASRTYVSSTCDISSPVELQSAFRYGCDGDQCYYDLAEPILIDTSLLGTKSSKLNGKLAAGNFNYRHIDVAVNLVGTGVHDCSQSQQPSCYATGFIEYTLTHDAFNSAVINHTGATQSFNFGAAYINHGKGLAAERYITVPVGSADQGLLSQPGILKTEYMGRPLDGNYRLRIWDTPGLMWNRLEDIQIILKYRYWSRIDKQPGSH